MFRLPLLLLSLAVPNLLALDQCSMPGLPGIPGFPGRDGRDGLKGEKGDPGISSGVLGPLKGEVGEPGPEGYIGKRGLSGEPGEPGIPGTPGLQGEPGEPGEGGVPQKAAFSVARGTHEYPDRVSVIRFMKVITNLNNDYNIQTGRFRCRIQGTYYFVYHASIDNNLCVKMKLNDQVLASFCDHRRNRKQVTSGGLAVYVPRGQEVYLETTDYKSMRGLHQGYSVFSGFLLQAH